MIYIAIPTGMKHSVENITIENVKTPRDLLICESGKRPDIDLQQIVKNALQHRRKSNDLYTENGVTIYYKRPPYDANTYLKYEPQNNGKYPATKCELVCGQKQKPYNPATQTSHAASSFWYQHLPMSSERRKEIVEKQREQRDNRRHDGDSPLAT